MELYSKEIPELKSSAKKHRNLGKRERNSVSLALMLDPVEDRCSIWY